MKERKAVVLLGLLIIITGAVNAYDADVGTKDTRLQSAPPNFRNHSKNTAGKNPFAAGVAPLLAQDIPEIGLAAFKGDVGTLRRLISSGTNVERTGKDKRTPLLLAAAGCRYEAVRILLNAGAKINARDSSGATALHWAALKGDEKVVLLLLRHHAKVNVQEEFGGTPLISAAMIGDKTIVEALIASGANPNLADGYGWTASAWARRNKYLDIASLLDRTRK